MLFDIHTIFRRKPWSKPKVQISPEDRRELVHQRASDTFHRYEYQRVRQVNQLDGEKTRSLHRIDPSHRELLKPKTDFSNTQLSSKERIAALKALRQKRLENQVDNSPKVLEAALAIAAYKLDRSERPEDRHIETADGQESQNDLAETYYTSPQKSLIPMLLKELDRKGKNRKLRVLDIGAGTSEYANDLREAPESQGRVKVFSTGLSKRTARNTRRIKDADPNNKRKAGKLHKHDLVAVSIEDLHKKGPKRGPEEFADKEAEFDLILSSNGEIMYAANQDPKLVGAGKVNDDELKIKLSHVMRKLNDGGIACLSPFSKGTKIKPILEELSKEMVFDFDLLELKLGFGDKNILIRKNAKFKRNQVYGSFSLA